MRKMGIYSLSAALLVGVLCLHTPFALASESTVYKKVEDKVIDTAKDKAKEAAKEKAKEAAKDKAKDTAKKAVHDVYWPHN